MSLWELKVFPLLTWEDSDSMLKVFLDSYAVDIKNCDRRTNNTVHALKPSLDVVDRWHSRCV